MSEVYREPAKNHNHNQNQPGNKMSKIDMTSGNFLSLRLRATRFNVFQRNPRQGSLRINECCSTPLLDPLTVDLHA